MTTTAAPPVTVKPSRGAPKRRKHVAGGTPGRVLRGLGIAAALFFILFPILWLALTAFKTGRDVYSTRVFVDLSLANFRDIFGGTDNFLPLIWNSVVVSVGTVAIAVPLAALAAYGFSRFPFRGTSTILLLILGTQFIPPVAVALPVLNLYRSAGLLDTRLGLVLINLAIIVPYITWLLLGFVESLPREVEEAARVDGCGQLRLMRYVVVPLMMPGVIVAATFAFILSWNEFLFPFFLTKEDALTLPVGLLTLVQPELGVLWGHMSVAGLIVLVPMAVLSVAIRKHFTEGITMGAVK